MAEATSRTSFECGIGSFSVVRVQPFAERSGLGLPSSEPASALLVSSRLLPLRSKLGATDSARLDSSTAVGGQPVVVGSVVPTELPFVGPQRPP